ncbi:tRNA-aminoacylation cofactor ARC1 [Nakaseomyces bracarensis]|uniref:tRNA-aminoacylation cofactor ARC1 n=1 Tax=Nakaseomyces bracarensis TaxID=273131 RepID=A0ABR4NQ07_9SACH
MSDLVAKFKGLSIAESNLSREQLAQVSQWESILKTGQLQANLGNLNLQLRDNTFIASTAQPTVHDVELFEATLPVVKELVSSTKDVKNTIASYRHVIRWVDYLQSLLQLSKDQTLEFDRDIELPREIIEKPKKKDEKKEAPAEANKKNKKEESGEKKMRGKPDEETLKKLREEAKAKKAAKKAAQAQQQQDQAKAPEKPQPSVIDFRVGFIQKAIKHPDADSLYVSTIDVGDEEGPRTVCSGLVKHFPLEAMQERYVVVVCNLKPVNMRGIKSTAMVLCGSNAEDKVEFVEPPQGSKAGDKVFFEGFGEEEPLKQMNPKKKLWEQLQPHFTTDGELKVIFKDEEDKEHPIRKLTNAKGEEFKVATISNATVR